MAVKSSEAHVQNTHTVVISRLVGSDVAMTPDEGDEVRAHIERILDAAQDEQLRIVVSFSDLAIVTSAFLNTAIGRLYENYDWSRLSRVLSLADAPERYSELLRRVVKTAKSYYNDTDRFRRSVDNVVGDDE